MRQPIKKDHREVPRYQNIKFLVGLCEKFFKPPNIGGGLVGVDVSFSSFLCAKEKDIPAGDGLQKVFVPFCEGRGANFGAKI